MKSKILLLLNYSKNTMLTITEIAKQMNLEESLVQQELIKLKDSHYVRSSDRNVEIQNCWFCITQKGQEFIKYFNELIY